MKYVKIIAIILIIIVLSNIIYYFWFDVYSIKQVNIQPILDAELKNDMDICDSFRDIEKNRYVNDFDMPLKNGLYSLGNPNLDGLKNSISFDYHDRTLIFVYADEYYDRNSAKASFLKMKKNHVLSFYRELDDRGYMISKNEKQRHELLPLTLYDYYVSYAYIQIGDVVFTISESSSDKNFSSMDEVIKLITQSLSK